MTYPENIDVIMLIVAIILVLIIFTLSLVQTIRRKRAPIGLITIILLIIGVMLLVPIVYSASEIRTAEWVQIILMIGLVTVTAAYAYSTQRMAKEMREQRYDTVRPIIDIKRDTARADINRRTLEAIAASSGETVYGLSCILRNVGLGPAIDGCSFIQHPERERLPWEFGTLTSGEKTERRNLSIKHEGNRVALVAYYRDVYDRVFESSRKVSIEKKPNPDWVIGPLKIRLIERDKNND